MPSELSVHAVQQGPMQFAISDGEVDPARVAHALALSEAQICPVWAMLKVGTPVSSSYTVVAG